MSRKPILRFCLFFILFIILFAGLTATAVADRYLHRPLARLFASLSVPFLAPFGEIQASGTYLTFRGFGVEIAEACNGVLPTYVYLSAVLAFPSRWRDKLWGILIGIPAVFLINLVRIVTLVMFGAFWPDQFEQVHIYVWQALIVALSMGIWVFWAERFVRPRTTHPA